MTDRTHGDLNAKARAIIDDAIAELYLLGMESRSAAATLMAVQAIIRADDPADLETITRFLADLNDPEG